MYGNKLILNAVTGYIAIIRIFLFINSPFKARFEEN